MRIHTWKENRKLGEFSLASYCLATTGPTKMAVKN